MTKTLTPSDLQAYISANRIQARVIQNQAWEHTATVPAAAAALGVAPEQVIKSLLFLVKPAAGSVVDRQPVLVISHGERRVQGKAVAVHFGVGSKRVKLAPPEIVLALLGYPAGGVPPFGHRSDVPVVVDSSLLDLEQRHDGIIYGGGGDDRTMLQLTVSELIRVTKPVYLAVSA
jgi:prolyl-tRNA editing enzyme YbaK/EbsC (Cys-tRNA(Pro) deacylase)